ncbi:Uncharacterized protein APZ42_009633, partial [Daphnia magna]
VDGSLPGFFTETNATDDSPHVPLEKIRPLTQVCQMTPLAPRKRSSNRLGSTRIITDTPEKDKIEETKEGRRKKKKKGRKRKEKVATSEYYEAISISQETKEK